ncbi:hypothetical protein Poli38472_009487 [Pythium oligandrum]|uniref:Uncharacterized protein n=1 Tax=Pythium oligandrum TaxID=41045 RepID=A0A8K1FIE5_PYTOL|nr:hypothetical protein Poli38472_009487 [Pythium oligandrum]|eukprot:TMW61994.1 hypothetical protein Poli38472_009487 [Pythium oligandrum]
MSHPKMNHVALERVRQAESHTVNRRVTNTLRAICCPCVSAAQVASSLGYSFYVVLLEFSVLYLTGLAFSAAALSVANESGFNLGFIISGLLNKTALYCIGPLTSALVIPVAWSVDAFEADENALDNTRVINKWTFILLGFNAACDFVFMLISFFMRRKFRQRIGVEQADCSESCGEQCCVWISLSAATASAEQFGEASPSCFGFGPLDVIPAYEDYEQSVPQAVIVSAY